MRRVLRAAMLHVRVVALLAVCEASLRLRPLPATCRTFGVRWAPSSDPAPTAPTGTAGAVVVLPRSAAAPARALARVLRRWPRGADAACLRRSLVLGHVLREREPSLTLGVRRDGDRLRAHAWLVVDGVALDTTAAGYAVLARG